jgi:hypothetical protein
VLDFVLNGTTEVVSLTLSNPAGDKYQNTSFPLTRFDAIMGLVEYGGACNIDNNKEGLCGSFILNGIFRLFAL